MHWGLIPHWTADPSIGNRMINARAETLTELPSFKPLVDRRRCVIPVDGFYERRKEGKRKVPMLCKRRIHCVAETRCLFGKGKNTNAPLASPRGSLPPEGVFLSKKRGLIKLGSIKSAKGVDERDGGRTRRRDSRACVPNLARGRISVRTRGSALAKSRSDLAGETSPQNQT